MAGNGGSGDGTLLEIVQLREQVRQLSSELQVLRSEKDSIIGGFKLHSIDSKRDEMMQIIAQAPQDAALALLVDHRPTDLTQVHWNGVDTRTAFYLSECLAIYGRAQLHMRPQNASR